MMKNRIAALSLVVVLLFGGCSKEPPVIKGSYQSEVGTSYTNLISFDDSDNSFVEYINSREVDRGTYELIKDNKYNLKSDIQNFEIRLGDENSFEISIKNINNGKPILLKNVGDVPVVFVNKYGDEETYKALL